MNVGEGRFSSGAMAVAFLLGGAVGAGLAVLLTPKSGPETRERIRRKADAMYGETVRIADDVREKAGDLLEKGKELVEQKKAILESAMEAGKEAMSQEKERLLARIKKEEKDEPKGSKT